MDTTPDLKTALAVKYNVPPTHPKLGKLFDLAYEHGHSSGLEAIEACFAEFAELITVEPGIACEAAVPENEGRGAR